MAVQVPPPVVIVIVTQAHDGFWTQVRAGLAVLLIYGALGAAWRWLLLARARAEQTPRPANAFAMATTLEALGLAVLLSGLAWALKHFLAPYVLNWLKLRDAAKLQIEAETRQHEREDSAIRQRLRAAIIAQVEAMQRVYIRGVFPYEHWERLHQQFRALVETDDAARALSDAYPKFTDAVAKDQFTRNYVQGLENGDLHDAYVVQAIALQADQFASLLILLGDKENAARFQASAQMARENAERRLQRPPFQ